MLMPTVRTPLHTKLANQHTPNSIHADPKVRLHFCSSILLTKSTIDHKPWKNTVGPRLISFKFTYMCLGTMYIYIYIYLSLSLSVCWFIYIYIFLCLSVCLSVYLKRKDEAIHIKCFSAKQRVLLFLLVLCHGNRAVFPKPQLSKNNKKYCTARHETFRNHMGK